MLRRFERFWPAPLLRLVAGVVVAALIVMAVPLLIAVFSGTSTRAEESLHDAGRELKL